jgi:hypothetical protein
MTTEKVKTEHLAKKERFSAIQHHKPCIKCSTEKP